MSEKIIFEPTPEQFGIFWKYLSRPEVTDVDYNGQKLWITDLKEGRYCANEEIPEYFISTFTHNISNCINKQFNNANKILEADTKELRISIIHESAAISGISICIRKSPCFVRNTLENLLDQKYCEKEVLASAVKLCAGEDESCFWRGAGGRQDRMCKIFYAVYQERKSVLSR